jgi:twinkle protein
MRDKGTLKYHSPCQACGSKDNKAVYEHDDGELSAYCFGCGDYNVEGSLPIINNKEYDMSLETVQDVNKFPTRGFKERCITKDVADKYGVKVGYSESDGSTIEYHYYPTTRKNEVVGYSRREVSTKKFIAIGDTKNDVQLFGQSLFQQGAKKLVITEGELDAMSVQQMYANKNNEYPVVSITNGVGGAKKQIAANLDWINSFEEVIFMFDADEVGKNAASECAKLIRTGKAKIANLGRHGKDASDYLVSQHLRELDDSVWRAEKYSPSGIINSASTWEEFSKDMREDSVLYPACFCDVNTLTYGRRTGELTIFTAGTGTGKSSFIKEDIYHLLTTTEHQIGVVSLEESVKETLDGIIGLHVNKRINLPDTPFDRKGKEGKEAWDAVAGTGRFTLLDHQGSLADNSLMDKIEYLAATGCKFIYLDHITIAVSEVDGDINRGMDRVMSDLLKLCKKFDVWVGVVSHLRKTGIGSISYEEGADVTEDSLKGSGSLKQIAFQIIAFSRNKYAETEDERNQVKLTVLKNRFTGKTGYAGSAKYNDVTGRLHSTKMRADEFTVEEL